MPDLGKEFEEKDSDELGLDEPVAFAEENEDDNLRITDESIAIVAGVAATEVESVARMSAGFAGGIVEALGRHNPAKGVKVEMVEDEAVIDLYVIVNYGNRISDIAWEIQEHVKDSVEKLTGVVVAAVNIHVQGIEFEKKIASAGSTADHDAEVVKKNKTRDMSVFQFFDDVDDE